MGARTRALVVVIAGLLWASGACAATVQVPVRKDVKITGGQTQCVEGNLGNEPSMAVGWSCGKVCLQMRSLVHFDLAAAGVPAGAIVTSVGLHVYVESQTGGNFATDVFRLTQPAWNEGISTWWYYTATMGGGGWVCTPWQTTGGDFTAAGGSSWVTAGASRWRVIDVTALAQDALSARAEQLHLLLKAASESGNSKAGNLPRGCLRLRNSASHRSAPPYR